MKIKIMGANELMEVLKGLRKGDPIYIIYKDGWFDDLGIFETSKIHSNFSIEIRINSDMITEVSLNNIYVLKRVDIAKLVGVINGTTEGRKIKDKIGFDALIS